MNGKVLGDSYDVLKRFWAESLRSVAPLYAHEMFVPDEIRAAYTGVTSIPILFPDLPPNKPFGILLDPDKGIRRPSHSLKGATPLHISLPFIVGLDEELRPYYMVCFDQSFNRKHELSAQERNLKREFLRERGIASFYYISHAPFLFMARAAETVDDIRGCLSSLGIPKSRFDS
jgi:hypothetical protein